MDEIRVYRVDAFTCRGRGGNRAGVVLGSEGLSREKRQELAEELGYSETVFIERLDERRFKAQFYTPSCEVELCGHATIGYFGLLHKLGIIDEGEYEQVTRAGNLRVRVAKSILMEQTRGECYGVVPREGIAESLGISLDELGDQPVEIVSTGLKDIMIPIGSYEIMRKIRPNYKKVEEISREYGVVGYHLFSLESLDGNTAFTRNLAPLYGIDEESATGTSNGALGTYLVRHGLSGRRMVFEQGDLMGSPSRIEVVIAGDEVWVGGEVSIGGGSSGE